MTGVHARVLAATAVHGVVRKGLTLTAAWNALPAGEASEYASEGARIKALSFGALRWHHRHLAVLAALLARPLPRKAAVIEALLSVALYELDDAREPDYAIVSAAVDAARALGEPHLAGLVNATLRRYTRERDALLPRLLAADEVARWSCPAWLIGRLRADWPEHWSVMLEATLRQPPLWLRVNPLRREPGAYLQTLTAAGLGATSLPGLPGALRLDQPLPVGRIPGFAAGEVTVQDAASQLAARILAPEPGMRFLDACAAPGGKTTHLLESAAGKLELLALDVDDARLDRLRENLARLGLAAEVRAGDALAPDSWWDGRPFDRILLDAPCSGTGVLRRHPDIKVLRRESDIAPLAGRQLALLEALWPLLRPGGRLLYATCSVLRAENSTVIRRFLDGRPDAALLVPEAAVAVVGGVPGAVPEPAGGLQILPGSADTDGLYYALMERRSA